MPSRARLDEFIAVVVSGDHAGAIERYYTEYATMQENAAAPRVGRDLLVAQERATLERVKSVTSTCVSVILEGDRVAINWVFDFIYHSGRTARIDEVTLQEWRGDRIFRERFFYDPPKKAS
jgi:ketosteroid isomerase-like protein